MYIKVKPQILACALRSRGYFLSKVTLNNDNSEHMRHHEVFVPLTKDGVTNADVQATPPSPGTIVYQFEERFLYPTAHT